MSNIDALLDQSNDQDYRTILSMLRKAEDNTPSFIIGVIVSPCALATIYEKLDALNLKAKEGARWKALAYGELKDE